MSLYLCVFEEDEDLEGVEVGPYADFGALRDYIVSELEGGTRGKRVPAFLMHSDCDGEWSVADCLVLRDELTAIASELKQKPPVPFQSDWQRAVAKSVGLVPKDAFESFI